MLCCQHLITAVSVSQLVIQCFDAVKVDRTRSWLYAACSLSYLGAMVSSNSALQFVNYPTQVKKGSLWYSVYGSIRNKGETLKNGAIHKKSSLLHCFMVALAK